MSKVPVYYKKNLAGFLEKTGDDQFIFEYEEEYLNSQHPALSLTLPKAEKRFESSDLLRACSRGSTFSGLTVYHTT